MMTKKMLFASRTKMKIASWMLIITVLCTMIGIPTSFAAGVLKNVALGKTVTSANTLSTPEKITDGNLTTGYVGVGADLRWIQIDLGKAYDVQQIKLWHYYGDGRILKDVVIMVSNDSTFGEGVTTVFNNDADNSAGFGTGTDAEYAESAGGKSIDFTPVSARYVRLYSGGNANGANPNNHYYEVEVGAEVPEVTEAPEAPTGLTVGTAATTSIKLDWTKEEDISYNVYRSTSSTGEYTKINTNNIYTGSFTDTGLTANTTYYYKVTAVNIIGESDFSAYVQADTTDFITTANINMPSTAETNSQVCFDGSYSTGKNPMGEADDKSGIKLYSWDFGDGTPVVSGDDCNTVTHKYTQAGTYTVTLTATDFRDVPATAAKTISVVGSMTKVQPAGFTSTDINNAISSLSGQPGIVTLQEGTYTIASTVNVPSNVTLQGAGTGTVLNSTVNDSIKAVGDNIRITNLVLRGPGESKNGIVIYGNKNVMIDNCEISGFEIANSVSYYSSVTFEKNYIHNNPKDGLGYGIMVVSGSYSMIRDNTFENNRHSIAGGGYGSESGWKTSYDIYNNTFGVSSIETADVMIDAHAGTQGRIRVVDNLFKGHDYSIGFRDGWGEITGNRFEDVGVYICKFDVPLYSDGKIIPNAGCHDFKIADNEIINFKGQYTWRMLYGIGNIVLDGNNIDDMIPHQFTEITETPQPPFEIIPATLDKLSGITATVNVRPLEGHEGKEVVVFELMNGATPVSIVAVSKDIVSAEDFTAYFNVPALDTHKVKVFVLDQFNSDTSAPVSLADAKLMGE